MPKPRRSSGPQNQLRIIGGQWRGRKLAFPDVEGLRPTPDRVRETLFNWLNQAVVGARCLDCFTGSGALGLEALSRGASAVTMIDSSPQVVDQLRAHLSLLNAEGAELHQANAESWLAAYRGEPFDIIFLDPPFHQQLVAPMLKRISERGLLSEAGLIYLEMAADEAPPALPTGWQLHREKQAGQVSYRLITVG